VIAGVAGGRADGLTAALVIFGAYSIAFAIRLISGPPPPPGTGAPMSAIPAPAPGGPAPTGPTARSRA
jgi:hypothetical protein